MVQRTSKIAQRSLNFVGLLGLSLLRHGSRAFVEMMMAWKAPKIIEVPVGMEINMYACATRK